jgi:hypothetical protein
VFSTHIGNVVRHALRKQLEEEANAARLTA